MDGARTFFEKTDDINAFLVPCFLGHFSFFGGVSGGARRVAEGAGL